MGRQNDDVRRLVAVAKARGVAAEDLDEAVLELGGSATGLEARLTFLLKHTDAATLESHIRVVGGLKARSEVAANKEKFFEALGGLAGATGGHAPTVAWAENLYRATFGDLDAAASSRLKDVLQKPRKKR